MRIWDIATQRQLKASSAASSSWALDIVRNDSVFATGHKSGEIKLWSLQEMKEMQSIKNLHRQQVTCVKFSADGTKLVTASCDNTLKVIDLRTSQTLQTLEHSDLMISAAGVSKFGLSPNGKYCVVGGNSGTLFIFNLEEGYLEEAYDE